MAKVNDCSVFLTIKNKLCIIVNAKNTVETDFTGTAVLFFAQNHKKICCLWKLTGNYDG
jgi:hypothetical protein